MKTNKQEAIEYFLKVITSIILFFAFNNSIYYSHDIKAVHYFIGFIFILISIYFLVWRKKE